jgi:transposase InsO family protein
MLYLKRTSLVVHVKLESKLLIYILQKLSCQHQGHLSYFTGSIWTNSLCKCWWQPHYLVIVDDFSRYTWVFFLHDKSEVAYIFKKFAKKAQNELDCKIKKIRSDNGKEFDNTNIHEYCDEIGIKHEVSTTYTPQQNGVVERKNRTLITLARTMIDEYNTLERFWA